MDTKNGGITQDKTGSGKDISILKRENNMQK